MRKLFSLFVALFATINLWSYDFQYGDLYYKFGNAEGIENPDTIGWNIPAECLTVAQAREICAALENGATTGTKYYVKGWVKKLAPKHEEGVAKFGNAQFYMEDVKNANSQDDFMAYQVYGPNDSKITSLDQVLVGDYVVLYGELTNYNGTYETVGRGAAYIWKSSNPALGGNGNTGNLPTDVVGAGTFENPYTASDVVAMANTVAGNYYVKACIVGQVNGMDMDALELSAPWGTSDGKTYNTNIVIASSTDETNAEMMVPVQLPSGALRTGLNLPENPDMHGKEILIYGSLEKYFGAAGVKATQYAKVGDKEFGTKPVETTGEELLYETLLTQASFDKFTTISVSGEQVWSYDASRKCAKMSGYANAATIPNEDWFISPAMDLSSVNAATLTFNHAFGPASLIPTTDAEKAQYTIWVSNDFDKDVKAATWTELKGMVYGTTGWGYVSSGNIAIPAENLKANCRIAWKYVCDDVSATWEIKEIMVKPVSTNAVKQKSTLEAAPTTTNDQYVIVTWQTIDENNYNTLTDVEIPETVEYNGITYIVSGIDDYAFAYAENLQSITIPQNIKAIGNCAFANCYNLQSITFTSEEPPHIFYETFDNMYSDVQMYVPCGTVSAYQSAGIYNAQEPPAEYNIYLSEVGGNARIDYNTLCGARISAYPDYGYHFVQWSDGNTDNPRIIELTQDTILAAEFAQIISGRCGDNLYWSYNESDQSISITGSGEMYNYTSETQPWLLFKEQIKMLTTSNTTTSIGESAFAGAIRLADVHLGSNIETIAENAFAECNRLYHIYCYPTYPPFAKQTSFANYNIYLHVPCEYKEDYDLDVVFGNFKYIECLGAETDNTSTDTVIVNASSTHVTITWPTEENANTYTIVIKNGDIVFCTLIFNANGQLLNIAFTPAKNGSNRTAQHATQTANGLRFTVTGLNESTHYTYDITAKNNEGDTIQTHTGAFTTKSNASTEVDNINAQTSATQKLFHNNQLLILRDGKTYTIMGQEL